MATDPNTFTTIEKARLAKLEELRHESARAVADVDARVAHCCGEEVGERFCEEYGCTTLLELVAPIRQALAALEAPHG